ncbi:TPA: restriction endonuclease subunit S [Salmonella enterica]|uniref:restriction endonuclease subunit S n=2 Tax=Salmonella enterica TaxID=28901 RepID=UPI0012808BFA|nr:restriction endonuclease subunit S [Salmonella enterica subsp. enterica serovar Vejle]ECL1611362.1 restriction endonuclease subunit S [Salmonella enterica subsp. enterica]EDU4390944.1 restriction endonuclease subunit S [Salmonella enterica subsp. enterica serovar Cuckmere]EJD7620037.1 restriction endonuclease subunit S [Salmonella enterica]EJN2821122.1 restriction endonuclease subunit S [Salmonella enterica subsp. enterica serovar Wimborne]
MAVEKLIVDHIDTWTTALQTRSTAGRGSSGKIDLYGIKKLRELILELAVRGKLVPQDPNDEPASVLLERIAAEKAELMKQGKIKKQKPLPEISEEEKPFELPVGWEWTRLINLGTWALGSGFPNVVQGNSDKEILMCKVSDMNLEGNEKFIVSTINTISKDLADEYKIKTSEPGTIIFPKIGGAIATNKRRILVQETAIDNNCLGIKPCNAISGEWFYLILSALDMSKYQSGTSIPAINQSVIGSIPIALPSLKMQEKILSYVITLMSLCDQLELHSLTSLDAHQQLVETLLTTLTDSQNADELTENWARISEHFDTLFTTEPSIEALKQTILQLAVMGKLVPQDPNDEPVEKLLSRAKTHQQKRIENKEIQKNKKIDGVPYPDIQIPKTSSFILLNELAFITKLAGFEYTNYFSLEDAGEVPVVRAQNVKAFNLKKDNLKFISYDVSKKLNRSALSTECLLMTFIGAGIGDTCIFEENKRWHLAPNVAKIEPFSDIDSHYLNIYLNSFTGRNEIFKSLKATAQPSLSMSTIREIMVILPPLQEQKRIVKKTNELLALCDKINHYIQSAQQTQLHLADALTNDAIN